MGIAGTDRFKPEKEMNGPLSARVASLLQEQKESLDPARANYAVLEEVRVRPLDVDGFGVLLQYNPARIRSSAARVDASSVKERKCFLCPANRPENQLGIPFGGSYEILVNPYPIFPDHLTVASLKHEDQHIRGRFADMLALADALPDFVVFYNGPRCGASAPDHMHFQAGSRGVLPVEKEWKRAGKEAVFSSPSATLYAVRGYTHPFLLLVSSEKEAATALFDALYGLLPLVSGEAEPMMNLLVWREDGRWLTCLFPREKLRPCCYYLQGKDHLLLSPASVEMGGLFALVREEDFLRITAGDIRTALGEVCLSPSSMDALAEACKIRLNV